jgi:hypothetical protein
MATSPMFEIIDCLTFKKQRIDFDDPEMEKAYDTYMIDNALSMCDMLIPIVNKVSMLNLPKKQHEALYQELLPQRRFYFDWVKRKKTTTHDDRVLVADYYNCSLQTADEYIELLTDDQLKSILKMYKYGEKSVIKV